MFLAAGAVLFGGASLFHPPTVNPWDPSVSLAAATQGAWTVDHWALLIAVTLVHLGLFVGHASLRATGGVRVASVAYALSIASLVLWLSIFLFEATGWPILARTIAAQAGASVGSASGPGESVVLVSSSYGATLEVVARTLWATVLTLGYAAAFVLALAIALWSIDLTRAFHLPRWFARLGVIGGCYTAVVQPLSLGVPSIALWLLIPAAAVIGAWLLATAWFSWTVIGTDRTSRKDPGESRT